MKKNLMPPNSNKIIEIINHEIAEIEHGLLEIKFHIRDSEISRITLNRELSILSKDFFSDI